MWKERTVSALSFCVCFFAILHFLRSVGRAGARGFLFFLKFCVCGKSYLILSCGKSSRPVQPPGESQDIVSRYVIVKAESTELAYCHFLFAFFIAEILSSCAIYGDSCFFLGFILVFSSGSDSFVYFHKISPCYFGCFADSIMGLIIHP